MPPAARRSFSFCAPPEGIPEVLTVLRGPWDGVQFEPAPNPDLLTTDFADDSVETSEATTDLLIRGAVALHAHSDIGRRIQAWCAVV